MTEKILLYINGIEETPIFDEYHPWWSKDIEGNVLFMRRKWADISKYR